MAAVSQMLTVARAMELIQNRVVPASTEIVRIADAWSRVLAESISAPHDSPPFDKSLMDGFAVRTADFVAGDCGLPINGETPDPSRLLRVIETVTAGCVPQLSLGPGTASRIMTGALLPEGADCVVPIEFTDWDASRPECVRIPASKVSAESCLIRKGTAARAGSLLLSDGTPLRAAQIAALAEFGIGQVTVRRRPTIGVLATGDELLSVDEPLVPGRIRNSNEPMLVAQVHQEDAIPVSLGVARDSIADLSEKIQQGLKQDFLLLTGGVSAGALDLVPDQLAAAGVEKVFHGVQMKPGKPLWFGVFRSGSHSCYVFGLPGNPVSSLTCFELFVRTAVRRFLGAPHPVPKPLPGKLAVPATVRGSRPIYHPVRTELTAAGLLVTPVPWSGSSDLRATVEADGMALMPMEPGEYPAGHPVDVFLWSRTPWQ
ncbi:MAG: gephyrin-like molybdotransferase Glp [Planctomyces sp.]